MYNYALSIALPVDEMWISTFIDTYQSYPQAILVNSNFYTGFIHKLGALYIYRINITVTIDKIKLLIEQNFMY